MEAIRIDETNWQTHAHKIALAFGFTEDYLRRQELLSLPDTRRDPAEMLTETLSRYQNILGAGAGAAVVWLVTGALAKFLLKDLPIQGFTLMERAQVTCVLTWFKNPTMLRRLFVHEWCHARRIVTRRFTCQAEYVRYLVDPTHWLYEEMLAIATEKRLFPHISWEVAAGHPYNPHICAWNQEGIISDAELITMVADGYLDQWLRHRELDPALVYYLAYRLCRLTQVFERLEELMTLPSREGLERLIASPERASAG